MADSGTPVSIGRASASPPPSGDLDTILGQSAADVIRLHMGVIDREDRLESGTGAWREEFAASDSDRRAAVEAAVLRAIHTASDAVNFKILSSLRDGIGTPISEIAAMTGLGRVPLAERIGDLVSAGLAVKIPEANQVSGTAAGTTLVALVGEAAGIGGRDLEGES